MLETKGFILLDLLSGFLNKGRNPRAKTEKIKARTPPSLLGIARRTAYIGRKYHSGAI
jgi:hypothetical protein